MAAKKSTTKDSTTPPAAPRFVLATAKPLADRVTVHCLDGETNRPLGLSIDVATQWSKHARAAQFKAVEHYRRDHPDVKADSDPALLTEAAGRYILAHCILAWDLQLNEGEECPVAPEIALQLFDVRGDVFVQVKRAYEESRSFFEPVTAN